MLVALARSAPAAVGCSLDDPDRDIRRIYPEATGFRTEFITIKERGGQELAAEIERKLGDKLEPIYETTDVPFAFYTVLKGKEIIGYVHGVNQKGKFGGMQLVLATDIEGKIIDFYYQKLSSPEARAFRDRAFTGQFVGMTLTDFYAYRSRPDSSRVGAIHNPSKKNPEDFAATLRGLTKNLILLDIFYLDRRHDTVPEKKGNDAQTIK